MADEIEYLRGQLVGPQRAAQIRGAQPAGSTEQTWDFLPSARHSPHYTSEEQEEIQALKDGGHLSELEYRQAMAAIGLNVTGVEIDEDKPLGIPDDPLGFFADDE